MARPLRIEFPGALYHVTASGDRREHIVQDDDDRERLLHVLGQGLARFDAQALAYCVMDNHYHWVLRTHRANLSQLMRHINGVYSQAFNRRHGLVGHLFQGRFKAIVVDRDAYLLEVCRYVELNPVRAAMVAAPQDWPWSSYRAHVGLCPSPPWLDTAGLHGLVLGHDAHTALQRRQAAKAYADLVAAGRDVKLWDQGLRQQIYLGDEDFVERVQRAIEPQQARAKAIPRAQRSMPKTLQAWLAECASRELALWHAYTDSGISMTAMASELGLTVGRISQLIKRVEPPTPNANS